MLFHPCSNYSRCCVILRTYMPVLVGESEEWAAIISSAEDNRENYCKVLWEKHYSVHCMSHTASSVKVAIKNYFVPLQTMNMDTNAPTTESNSAEEAAATCTETIWRSGTHFQHRHAKEGMWKKKAQGTPKNTTGRVFSSNLIQPKSVLRSSALRPH
jgi:hypothetical protein